MKKYNIKAVDDTLLPALRDKIDRKTKPVGALGRLEQLAVQIGRIQNTLEPRLIRPHILVFAADHGIASEGVSAYPQEVTYQMVMNFLHGGAAINVFCRQHGIEWKVVDAGVDHDFPKEIDGLVHIKAGKGTGNFKVEPAMSVAQAHFCIDNSANLVKEVARTGCTVIGFGDMGIGNTSSAAMLMSVLCNIPLEFCVGMGTGLDDDALQRKKEVLQEALNKHGKPNTPLKALTTYGGFEIAQIAGAILQASECGMIILIDGFIASSAFLVAYAIEPKVKDYCIFCHQSHEHGHQLLLQHLNAEPLVNLNMRLGEGTGAAVAYPIVQSAVNFLNEMASFESASIATKS
jgi:nicotinate-nucleotide--dimethylbenzimidazole phosphoribosyltransferase